MVLVCGHKLSKVLGVTYSMAEWSGVVGSNPQ